MSVSYDLSGMQTTLASPLMADWDRTIRGVLSHAAATGPDLNKVLDAAPDFALGHAIKGLSCLMLGRAELISVAADALATARIAATRQTPSAREMVFVDALADWMAGQPSQAAARMQTMLDAHPRDALAMKLIQAIHFIMGRPTAMRQSVEAVLGAWGDHPAKGFLFGCHAFSLEETGEYARAEQVGCAGIELANDDAWGLHAVAHVHDMTGRARDGLVWLEGREASWAHCNNFRFHVWWHRALMYLDLGEYDQALAVYDRDIRAEKTDDYRDVSNAASLLSRLELEGICVGNRWEELADLSERRATDGCLAFADLHYLLALIGGDRDTAAAKLIGRMSKARPDGGEANRIIAHPGLRVANGLQAFAAGEYSSAWLHLRESRTDLQQIGGSHAQRDVFARITIEAALRGGYLDAAERLLGDRTRQRANQQDGYTSRRLDLIHAARTQAV
jgi:tetratricopeptide (TPR) repeat protein